MLNNIYKEKSFTAVYEFLWHQENEDDKLFDRIVTKDESFISYLNVETKQQLMQWWHSTSPVPKNFKRKFNKKACGSVFFATKGYLTFQIQCLPNYCKC